MTKITARQDVGKVVDLKKSTVVFVVDDIKTLSDDFVKSKVSIDPSSLAEAKQRVTPKDGSDFSAPVHTDAVYIFNTTYKGVTRHNCAANPLVFEKFVKSVIASTRKAKRAELHFVIHTMRVTQLPLIDVIARQLPVYNTKTSSKDTLENVYIELATLSHKQTAEEAHLVTQFCYDLQRAARIIDTPANFMHCDQMVKEAEQVAAELNKSLGKELVKTTIIRGEDLQKQGFGGIYSVGKASLYPPALVVLAYEPPGTKEVDSYALVGKGIVYDTGGTSLKPKLVMPTMKIDMGGAAALLSAFSTVVHSKFKERLYCVLCIAENHIGPVAQRPDDIQTMLSGKTVEVNNTDAEGRLVLADGVYYARHTLKARNIINMCTLTGAQAYATGHYHALLVSNSDEFERRAIAAGRRSGNLCHGSIYMPELYVDDLRSAVADMKNSNLGKNMGAPSSIAAHFIGEHLGVLSESDTDGQQAINWLHVDMAGLAFVDDRATGYGVSLIASLLAEHSDDHLKGFFA